MLIQSQQGMNFKIRNTFFDISSISRIQNYQSLSECWIYSQNLIANNFIFDNNTIFGTNEGGYTQLLLWSGNQNVTFTNNKLIDAIWFKVKPSLSIEFQDLSCPTPVYSRIIIENNTFYNSPNNIALTYLYLTLSFSKEGI